MSKVQTTDAFDKYTSKGQPLATVWLTDRQVAARYSVDRVTVYRWVNSVGFPVGVSLTPGTTRWLLADIEAWEAAKAAEAAA